MDVASALRPAHDNSRTDAGRARAGAARAGRRTGGTVAVDRLRAALARQRVRRARHLRAGRPARAQPAARTAAPPTRPRCSTTPSPPCAATPHAAGIELVADAVDHRPGRSAAAALPALRRDGASLRLDRPGRPGDDAPHRLDPGLPGLVAGREGLEQWRVLQPRRPLDRCRVRTAAPARGRGSRPGSRSTRTARPSTTGCCDGDPVEAYARFARLPPVHRAAPDHALPAGAAAGHLPRGALPRRPAARPDRAGRRGPRRRSPTTTDVRAPGPRASSSRGRTGWAELLAGGGRRRPRRPAGRWRHEHPLRHRPARGLLADIDATVGLMTAAQAEGAEVWVCGPEDLAVVDGRLHARARPGRARGPASAAPTTGG